LCKWKKAICGTTDAGASSFIFTIISSIQMSFSLFSEEWLALKCHSSQEIRLLMVSQYFSLIGIAVQ